MALMWCCVLPVLRRHLTIAGDSGDDPSTCWLRRQGVGGHALP